MSEQTSAEKRLPEPPLGLVPKFIHDEHRLRDIDAAIGRYVAAGMALPPEWIAERDELLAARARVIPPEGTQS